MDMRFIQQRIPESITTRDVIELYNCDAGGYMPGEYTVTDVESETGDVTLIGMGRLSGYVAVICLGATSQEADDSQKEGGDA